MRDSINQEDIDFYRKYGFVRIRALLNPDEVARLREHQDRAIQQRGEYRFADRDILSKERPAIDRMFVQRLNLWRDYAPIREFTLSPQIAKIAADLAGVDAIRLWHDAAFDKQAWANPTFWHYDAAYWSFNSPQALTVWVALSESNKDNGGLHFMPGSHLEMSYELPNIPEDCVGGLFELKGYEHWADRESVSLPLNPGDCTFHSGLTLHGSGANMTPHRRVGWTCAFMPDGALFNGRPNVLPVDYLSQLKVGDRLANDDFNPLLYKRSS